MAEQIYEAEGQDLCPGCRTRSLGRVQGLLAFWTGCCTLSRNRVHFEDYSLCAVEVEGIILAVNYRRMKNREDFCISSD